MKPGREREEKSDLVSLVVGVGSEASQEAASAGLQAAWAPLTTRTAQASSSGEEMAAASVSTCSAEMRSPASTRTELERIANAT